MRTNMQMLQTIDNWYPKNKYSVTGDEIRYIKDMLELDEMTIRDLRNMRDTIVLWFEVIKDDCDIDGYMKEVEKMSALTSIIDDKLFRLGAEV